MKYIKIVCLEVFIKIYKTLFYLPKRPTKIYVSFAV